MDEERDDAQYVLFDDDDGDSAIGDDDVGIKDGAFLATFGRGAIGRARSESRSTFVCKLIHEHLATEARQEMWAGLAKGSVTCGCGCVLSWAAPGEVSRLQWHMLECGLAGETAIRTRLNAAVRAALAKRIKCDVAWSMAPWLAGR